jgi:hypothetical protein
MNLFSNKGKDKINTICFLNKNLRFFEELQIELSEQFKDLFKSNKYSLIDSPYFIIDKKIFEKLKNKVELNFNYSKKGIIYENDMKVFINLSIDDLSQHISFFINQEKSTLNILYLEVEKVNEIFEDFTNISFKNPLIESKQLLDFVINQNTKKIDNKEQILKFLTKKINTKTIINKNTSLSTLEKKEMDFKYRDDKKFFNSKQKQFHLLKQFSEPLKHIIEETVIPLKTMNEQLFPLLNQLENRSNLILNIVKIEEDYENKLKIIKNFNKEIIEIKSLFENIYGNSNQSFKSIFEIRFNFIKHFLEPLLTTIDDDFEFNNDSFINKLYIDFNNKLLNLFKNISLIYKNMEKEESKIKQELFIIKYKNQFLIYDTDSDNIKNQKIKNINNFLYFNDNLIEKEKLHEKIKFSLHDINDFDIILDKQLNNLRNKIEENNNNIEFGITEEEQNENKKQLDLITNNKVKSNKIKNEINSIIEKRTNKIIYLIETKNFEGYKKLMNLRKKINEQISNEQTVKKYIDFKLNGIYFQEYLIWIKENYHLFNFEKLENEELQDKETYIDKKVINNIKKYMQSMEN